MHFYKMTEVFLVFHIMHVLIEIFAYYVIEDKLDLRLVFPFFFELSMPLIINCNFTHYL